MFTIKQLEALYWVGALGSFEAAADYLAVSQSTVSKRVMELETRFPLPLFDRSSRQSKLTLEGESVMNVAEQILRLCDKLRDSVKGTDAPPLRFRLG